ncbi:hypothetical protein [Hungatella effluvii]|uniref:hypothetical protein n=1 Tax=Hungatella effluvii TaxID=1096246 RepID=UPI0022E320B2|nr:hypothetical protein [Hungatella effluvii]
MNSYQQLINLKNACSQIIDLAEKVGGVIHCDEEIDTIFYEIELSKIYDSLLIAKGNLRYIEAPILYSGKLFKNDGKYYIDDKAIKNLDIVEILHDGTWVKTILYEGSFYNLADPEDGTSCRKRKLRRDSYKDFVFEYRPEN